MNAFAMGLELVRQWLPDALVIGAESPAVTKPFAVELTGTVGIARGANDQIEASIAGRLDARDSRNDVAVAEEPSATHARVEARRSSNGKLAEADPFVWLQLLDDQGGALTHETFLGHGVGMKYKVRARLQLSALAEPGSKHSARGARTKKRLASGVHARLVTRTYRNPAGPRYHTEVLVLPLLAAGADLPMPAASSLPALALVPALASERTNRPAPELLYEARPA